VAPSDWGFGLTPYGRPTIVTPALLAEGFTFNLSHSSELVVCAVRLKGALGVDTEHLKRDVPLSIAKSYFAISEVREMADLSPAQQPERFLRLWTLKESYVKARGMGLSLPLDQFGFCFPSPGRIAAFFHQGDTPSQWALWQLRFDSDNLIALCTENDCPLTLVIRQVVPLQTPHFLEIHDILSSA
jgi:4'-phosphopantetheinyl transferase